MSERDLKDIPYNEYEMGPWFGPEIEKRIRPFLKPTNDSQTKGMWCEV
jgi:hypothetical protein